MSPTFPKVQGREKGYNIGEVDSFLEKAREAYNDIEGDGLALTAEAIRHKSFGLNRGGYSTVHVDAALERLEDAFALREREQAFQSDGKGEWLSEARQTAQVILNRLTRPAGHRFTRTNPLALGYNRSDVDALADRLVSYFQSGKPIGVDTVRTTVFRRQRGGYSEAQVDLVLDAVTDVMLSVR